MSNPLPPTPPPSSPVPPPMQGPPAPGSFTSHTVQTGSGEDGFSTYLRKFGFNDAQIQQFKASLLKMIQSAIARDLQHAKEASDRLRKSYDE